jgi:hypothetical protein
MHSIDLILTLAGGLAEIDRERDRIHQELNVA